MFISFRRLDTKVLGSWPGMPRRASRSLRIAIAASLLFSVTLSGQNPTAIASPMNSKSFKKCFSFCVVSLCSASAFLSSNTQAYAQTCNDGSTLHVAIYSLTRTGGNTVTYDVGTETTGDYAADYQNYVDFSESAPGSTVIHSNSGTWSSAGQEVYYSYNDQPSVYGAGGYSATSDHESYASCYGYTSYPGNPVNLSLTVTQPTITTPGGFPAGEYAFWYLGAYPAIDGLHHGKFHWKCESRHVRRVQPDVQLVGIDRPGALSITGANTTSPTLTSQEASGGAVYDVSVVFTVDGFSSAKTWINLNTPVAIYVGGAPNLVSNPEGCANPNVNGGYDYQVKYYIGDLWNYAINPLTTNEKNDAYSNETGGAIAGWYMSPAWVDDDTWAAADWNGDGWSFTDHLEASNCGPGWTPPPVQPAGLNSLVQQTPQYWHTANATSNMGIAIGSDTQYWYTDHGNRN